MNNKFTHFFSSKINFQHDLQTQIFYEWHPDLDQALRMLPESTLCSHELYRLLLQNPGSDQKIAILVTDLEEPVAVIGLREKSGFWEPITQWLIPGMIFPFKNGYLERVLVTIGLSVHIAWWRFKEAPPNFTCIKNVKTEPVHRINLAEDYEAYWRRSKHYKNVKQYRNRCKNFEFRINCPGVREWTIKNWGSRWHTDSGLLDRLIVSEYLQEKGMLYTHSLHDKGEPIAGSTCLIHDNDIVAYVNYRNPEYDSFGVMTSLIDQIFSWAKEMSFTTFDIGGGHDYKKKWAPESGTKYEFDIIPNAGIIDSWLMRSRHKIWRNLKKIYK